VNPLSTAAKEEEEEGNYDSVVPTLIRVLGENYNFTLYFITIGYFWQNNDFTSIL